jgi:hypothetical protein
VAGAVKPNTKLLFAESPTNPLTEVCDIRALAAIARDAGALLACRQLLLHAGDCSARSSSAPTSSSTRGRSTSTAMERVSPAGCAGAKHDVTSASFAGDAQRRDVALAIQRLGRL